MKSRHYLPVVLVLTMIVTSCVQLQNLTLCPLVLPAEQTVIVQGTDTCAALAVREFNAIATQSTGKTIRLGTAASPGHHIFIGRSPEVEKRLGKALIDSLRNEESLVTSRQGDLFLIGGGDIGTLYAVYDFLEDSLGYRWYLDTGTEGQKIDRHKELVYNGCETRRRPAFTGYRKDHTNPRGTELFRLRNRDNSVLHHFLDNYHYEFATKISGHGFLYFIPAEDPKRWEGFRPKEIKGRFKEHPEYFSLDQHGKRRPDMQLCLSNPRTREALTEAVLAWIKARGKGIYMIGSNDFHNDRYCWCTQCMALEKRYKCVGGPLWDYILELCNYLKKNNYDGVYITSLAYKGPKQTERYPKGIQFPDNFICDAAFLNADRSLREVPEETLEDGTVFNRFKNLKDWVAGTHHVSYWFYGGTTPAMVYSRLTKEIRELHEAGVRSVGACGTGGGYEFRDMTKYIYYQLLQNPQVDTRKIIKDMLDFKYGPAAPYILKYIDELDQTRRKFLPSIPHLLGTDSTYQNFSFLSGKELVRWQRLLDKAEQSVNDLPQYQDSVRFARIGLDLFSIIYAHKIRQECPELNPNWTNIEKRGRRNAEDFGKRFLNRSRPERNQALDGFNEMFNFTNLKDHRLPAEVAHYPHNKVFRFLPPKRAPFILPGCQGKFTSEVDETACAGYAMTETLADKRRYPHGVGLEFYDTSNRKWLLTPKDVTIPLSFFQRDRYRLFKVGRTIIPKSSVLVTGNQWGSPTAITYFSRCFDPSYVEKIYELWISIKVQGKAFFPNDPRPNKIFIDQAFAIDCGMPVKIKTHH